MTHWNYRAGVGTGTTPLKILLFQGKLLEYGEFSSGDLFLSARRDVLTKILDEWELLP